MDTTNSLEQVPPADGDETHRSLAAADPADAPGLAEDIAAGLAAELESGPGEEEN